MKNGGNDEFSTFWNWTKDKGYQKFIIMQLPVRKAIDSEINLESRKHKGFSVTKQKDTTRSHPEHGRKDFSRRQYSEGSLPGR